MVDVTVSIVSADNLALLLPCLTSVFQNTHRATLEIYVVDNASTDGTAEAVAQSFPQVKVIRNASRLGFSTNNNLVLRRGQGRYLMLLNDDTIVLDSALDRMVAFMDAHPRAGVAGGFLMDPDQSVQRAFARFPNPLVEAFWAANNWSYGKALLGREPFEVDSVCGAAMLVRRQVIEDVGILDTAFDPIYSEETDWCYRINRAGWRVYALPEAKIVHYGSQTMRVVPQRYELLISHKALFFHKHYGAIAAGVYRACWGLATLAKLARWGMGTLWRRDVEHSRERLHLHWHLLKRLFAR